jgi:hypothetical protein
MINQNNIHQKKDGIKIVLELKEIYFLIMFKILLKNINMMEIFFKNLENKLNKKDLGKESKNFLICTIFQINKQSHMYLNKIQNNLIQINFLNDWHLSNLK